jgi:hypothetical protein
VLGPEFLIVYQFEIIFLWRKSNHAHAIDDSKEAQNGSSEDVMQHRHCVIQICQVVTLVKEDSYFLIKDRKKASSTGEFPTRLVVPAQNFTSAFPKLGYLAIQWILDSNHVDFSKRTIVQASDLKEKLESLHICRDDVTIISLDMEAM